MKRILFPLVLCLMFVGCEVSQVADEDLSVAWNTYEKKYVDNQIWEIVFTNDSLHTYWRGVNEVNASYVQKGSIVTCKSTKGIEFDIIAEKDYIIYSNNTFTKRR